MPSSIINNSNPPAPANPIFLPGKTPDGKQVVTNPNAKCNVDSYGPGNPMNRPIISSHRIVAQNTSSTTTKQALSPEEQQIINYLNAETNEKDIEAIFTGETSKEIIITALKKDPNSLTLDTLHVTTKNDLLSNFLKENINEFNSDELINILKNSDQNSDQKNKVIIAFYQQAHKKDALIAALKENTIPELLNQDFGWALVDLLKDNIGNFNEDQLAKIFENKGLNLLQKEDVIIAFYQQDQNKKALIAALKENIIPVLFNQDSGWTLTEPLKTNIDNFTETELITILENKGLASLQKDDVITAFYQQDQNKKALIAALEENTIPVLFNQASSFALVKLLKDKDNIGNFTKDQLAKIFENLVLNSEQKNDVITAFYQQDQNKKALIAALKGGTIPVLFNQDSGNALTKLLKNNIGNFNEDQLAKIFENSVLNQYQKAEVQQAHKKDALIKTLQGGTIPELFNQDSGRALVDFLKDNIGNFNEDQLAKIFENSVLNQNQKAEVQQAHKKDALIKTLQGGTIPNSLNQHPLKLASFLEKNISSFSENQLKIILEKSNLDTDTKTSIMNRFKAATNSNFIIKGTKKASMAKNSDLQTITSDKLEEYGFNENKSRALANAISSLKEKINKNHNILKNHSLKRAWLSFTSLFSETARQTRKNLILTAFNELKQNLDSISLQQTIKDCYRPGTNENNETRKALKLATITLFKEEIIQNPTILQGTNLDIKKLTEQLRQENFKNLDKNSILDLAAINLAAISHTDPKDDELTKALLQQYLTLPQKESEQSLKSADTTAPFTSNAFLEALNEATNLNDKDTLINLAAISHTDLKDDKLTKVLLQQYPKELEQLLKAYNENATFTSTSSEDFLEALEPTKKPTKEPTENEIASQ